MLGRFTIAIASLFLCLAGVEGGARILYCAVAEKRLSVLPREPASLFVRDPQLLYRQRPGFGGTWGRTHPVPVRVNSLGLRGPERRLARRPGSARVLVLGDSQSWGFDVREEEAYSAALERRLGARHPPGEPRYEVVNAAVPGYSSYQGALWLRLNMEAWRPDVVVAAFNFNDRLMAGDGAGDFSLVRHTPQSFASAWRWRWLERSFALKKARAWFARRRAGGPAQAAGAYRLRKSKLLERWETLRSEVTPEEHIGHLREIARLCRAHGARLILLALPEHPSLAAPLDSAARRIAGKDPVGARSALAGYFGLRDSMLLRTWSDYDVLANALARRARSPDAGTWPHRRAPANVVLATAGAYNALAAMAGEEERVPLVDATPVLSAHPGWFMDECHFDGNGHAAVARLLESAVREATAPMRPARIP